VFVASRDRQDHYFGTLHYDHELDRWDSVVPDARVSIHFTSDDVELEASLVRDGEALCRAFSRWRADAEQCAITSLLELKNEAWLSDDEHPLTAEEFRARILLEAVMLYSRGDVEFFFEDGDLFSGHAILVTGSIHRGLVHAHLAG
jgi:hypothetical protein